MGQKEFRAEGASPKPPPRVATAAVSAV